MVTHPSTNRAQCCSSNLRNGHLHVCQQLTMCIQLLGSPKGNRRGQKTSHVHPCCIRMWYNVSLIWSRQKESFPTNTKRCQQLSVSGLFLKSRKHQRRDCQCRRTIHSSTVWCAQDLVTRQIRLHCLQSCYWKDITVVIIQTGVFISHKCCSKAAFV